MSAGPYLVCMSLRGRLFAALYDPMMNAAEQAGMGRRRAELLVDARGDVLEVGAGTGANLRHYGPQVETLTLTEPEEPMATRLRARAAALSPTPRIVIVPAEHLPFDDESFDTVVCTLVLCTTADLAAALREMRRVLRPEGRLLFMEHVRSDDPRLARRQDRLNGVNRFLAYGCNCNRATIEAIGSHGFSVTRVERGDLRKTPTWLQPLMIGTATRA